ncbi:hypothetical protein Taro_006003 [Colocasia esculenta]|uniref:DUF7880 domain-containing protein n=1 Tax=Colocasia esculenta TaxID=4460 RepID=A0A843TMK4_COLES|nr:hypothetical protein [Colocasia esculenta]
MTAIVVPAPAPLLPHGGAGLPRPLRRRAAAQRRPGGVRCSVQPSPPLPLPSCKPVSRRAAAAALLVFHFCSSTNRADAGGPFDKYLKRKKLDPLETYVPAVLLSEEQFKDLEKYLDLEKPEYDVSRSLLRSGPAGSLRINIRAVAQYASEDGRGKVASDAVDQCLRALEDLDSLLLRASRNDPGASVQMMRQNIDIALVALDSLLQTVPSAVLEKGKLIADAYRTQVEPQEENNAEELDKDLKELETLL